MKRDFENYLSSSDQYNEDQKRLALGKFVNRKINGTR